MLRQWGANWRLIRGEWRLIILMMVYMILVGTGFVVRPDNSVSRFILTQWGISASFVGFAFISMGVTLPIIFQITQSLVVAFFWQFPIFLVAFSLIYQIATSPTAPIIHMVNFVFYLVMVLVAWTMVRELRFWRTFGQDMSELVKNIEDSESDETPSEANGG